MTKIALVMLLLTFAAQNQVSAVTLEPPKTGQTQCYDVAGNVISCAGTGQDGETQVGVSWPAQRFTDNLDGTVVDNMTGLIWLKNGVCTDFQPAGGNSWMNALAAAAQLHSGQCGLSDGSLPGDWRLPNSNEMQSLIDISRAYPSLSAGAPFQNASYQNYWTSTTYPRYSANAEGVNIGNGCLRADVKTQTKLAWPVKGVSSKLSKTGENSCWDANGTAIDCAGSRQDGETQYGAAWPAPRFADNGNGTMVDLLTHLVWPKNLNCFGDQASQQSALADAKGLASGACGLADGTAAGAWRLPNANEMRSLANYEQTNGGYWLNSQGFSNGDYCFYWTSDSYAHGVDTGWLPAGSDPSLGDKWMVNLNGSAWLSSWVIAMVPAMCKYVLPVQGPFDAACGSSNGQTFSSAPTGNLCTGGSASSLTGTGPWNWNCTVPQAPSITAACSANYAGSAVPSVTLTAPSSGSAFTAPATVTLTATATAGSGAAVKQVDFYNGSGLLATATTSPYSFTWNNVAAGSYTLTAKVTDTLGATATSSAAAITVNAAAAPTVRVSAPANGATFTAPATVAITAAATSGSGASVKQVDFFSGSSLLGSSTVSPYSYTWSNVPAGGYSLTAKVTDTLGATATSSAIAIAVNAPPVSPTVSITAPANGATYSAPATVTITAAATPGVGASVKQVDFYNGSTLLGSSTASPYSYTWSNAGPGNYSLTARLTDTLGATATSSAVSVTVNALPPTVRITAPASGAAYNAPATFTVTAAATAGTGATVKQVTFYKDGAPVVTSTTSPYSYTLSNVQAGSYSLTAMVTDTLGATATSTATAITVNTPLVPASVTIAAPTTGTAYASPATVTITANATPSSGAAVTRVDFYSGSTLLGSSTASPYRYTWKTGASGSYSLSAKVTDSLGATASSGGVGITVLKKR